MFFTQEDYRKIEKWILANSIKDTEFAGAALPLKGNETVAFVQDGINVNVSLKDLIAQIFLLGVSDFLNVTDKYGESYISLEQAIQLIPFKSRKIGQVITFLNPDGAWNLYQFQGARVNQWNNTTLWTSLLNNLSGVTANRPTGVPVGSIYFDTTLGKPIFLKDSTPTWVDSNGATV